MTTAIGYVRRSKKSDANTISLQEQEERIREYCQKENLECVAIVQHDGISGTKRKRFDVIESVIQRHDARALVVYHLDRLARDVGGLLDYLRSLSRRAIAVHESSGAGVVDLTGSTGFILTAVKGAFDELFPIIIGEKTTAALARKKAKGLRHSHLPPFGFAYKDNRLIPEPEEQRALAIMNECAKLGISVRKTFEKVRSAQYLGRLSRMTVQRHMHAPPNIP